MTLIDKVLSKIEIENVLTEVSSAIKTQWDAALMEVRKELEAEASAYLLEERKREVKTAELSKVYTLG